MVSLKRRISTLVGMRRLRSSGQRPALLLLILCALITASCLIFSARNVSTRPQKVVEDSSFMENSVSSKMFPPILPSQTVSHVIPVEVSNVVPDPPQPIETNDGINAKTDNYADYEEHESDEVGIFGSIATSLNLKPGSVLHKALNFVDSVKKLSDDGPPVVESVFSIAKGLHSMSKKVSEVNQKRNLMLVQGFVNSKEEIEKNDDDENQHESFGGPEIPVGPEARKNTDFEKRMKQTEKKPSLLKSIAQNLAPIVLSEISKSTNEFHNDGGPSIMENIFVNVGPKIIAEALGGNDDDGSTGLGMARSGFNKALKFLKPFVKSVMEQQNGGKENVSPAISSFVNVVGEMPSLFQGNDNNKKSLGDTMAILKPVLVAMGPSIMETIFDSKRSERSVKQRQNEAPQKGPTREQPTRKTLVDQMLNGMDEKTVGQAMGRALSSVLVKTLPDTVRLPLPSEIRRPYDMALNLVLGNPRNNSKEVWNWLRKLSGEASFMTQASSGDWVSEALQNPKRSLYKEDIRHFYGLLNDGAAACRDNKPVGGVYDWKKDIILSSRIVCEDFDLWKASSREAVSFGIGENWSFEEELIKRGHLRIHAVDPRLHQADHNHSKDIFFYAGRLSTQPTSSAPERNVSVRELPFAGWLERWGLLQKPLHFVKIDMDGNEWEILRSVTQDDPSSLEEIQQLSVTVHMDKAIQDPSLYAHYIEVLQTLATLGHQIFSAVPQAGLRSYDEPLVAGHEVVTAYNLGFVRT
ncbi:hypothetical protein FHG87_008694 [Trinorchestia longiramus]|nr:hypothetical protein FHG87_008694 [Trinorchestia longiramus]